MAICDHCKTELPDHRAAPILETTTIGERTPPYTGTVFVRRTLAVTCGTWECINATIQHLITSGRLVYAPVDTPPDTALGALSGPTGGPGEQADADGAVATQEGV